MTAQRDRDLSELLKRASIADRRTVAEWLAGRAAGHAARIPPVGIAQQLAEYKTVRSDEGSQLMKFRLPIGSYVRLQAWCDQNNLPMAAAVRGLVEMLLNDVTDE